VPLKPNMIVSNEPGYYIPGHYGIRIENLCFVTKSRHEGFVEFENLTLMPFEPKLIDKDLLTTEEREYIKQYYREIEVLINE
jgi:Xaa-Pro aminopeptidase